MCKPFITLPVRRRAALLSWLLLSAFVWFFGSPAWSQSGSASASSVVESFTANHCGDGTWLTWQAGARTRVLGFNVYRAEGTGKRTRLNPSLVAGTVLGVGGDITGPLTFAWPDQPPTARNIQYWLEAINLDGTATWFGPVTAGADCGATGLTRSPLLHESDELMTRATTSTQTEMPRALTALPTGNLNQQWLLAGAPTIKIGVRQSGWCRVTQAQLLAAGLNPAATPQSLQLFAEGKEVPIYVSAQNKAHLAATDYIEFYGLGFDIATTDTHIYWLKAGAARGLRIPISPTPTPRATPVTTFYSVIQSKPRVDYFSLLHNGDTENFFGPPVTNQTWTQTLQVANPALTGAGADSSTLEVAAQGVTQVPHTVLVKLNGVALGTLSFNGLSHASAIFKVAAKLLHGGANTVALTAGATQSDVSLLDYIRLVYPRQLQAVNNNLSFTATGGQSVTITGFTATPVRVLDVTNPGAVTEITPQTQAAGAPRSLSFQVPGAGARTLLAFANGQFTPPATVTRNNPSAWHTSHSADLVVIAHAAFMGSAAPLIAHRQQQGLAGQVVDVEDLYDEFTYGAHTPLAIKSFLARAKILWTKAPRFVLLLGDASYDPRNYFGKGDFDFVPTKLIDTSFTETASDDWCADFNDDGLPEMAVGRISIRTAAEANAVIAKIIGYAGVAVPGQAALLVSDSDRGYDFQAANDRVAALLPASLPAQKINRADGAAATVHGEVIAALNAGPLLVNFEGHGSVDIWTGAPLLTTTDALKLTNGQRLPLVLCSNCLNGYFVSPALEGLAEGLLNAPHGGAIAVWASSGETYPQHQEQMSDAFYRLMFQTADSLRPRTIGEAVVKAKAATSDLDVRRTWILFGDPSTELANVAPANPTSASDSADSVALAPLATPLQLWRWPCLPPVPPPAYDARSGDKTLPDEPSH